MEKFHQRERRRVRGGRGGEEDVEGVLRYPERSESKFGFKVGLMTLDSINKCTGSRDLIAEEADKVSPDRDITE